MPIKQRETRSAHILALLMGPVPALISPVTMAATLSDIAPDAPFTVSQFIPLQPTTTPWGVPLYRTDLIELISYDSPNKTITLGIKSDSINWTPSFNRPQLNPCMHDQWSVTVDNGAGPKATPYLSVELGDIKVVSNYRYIKTGNAIYIQTVKWPSVTTRILNGTTTSQRFPNHASMFKPYTGETLQMPVGIRNCGILHEPNEFNMPPFQSPGPIDAKQLGNAIYELKVTIPVSLINYRHNKYEVTITRNWNGTSTYRATIMLNTLLPSLTVTSTPSVSINRRSDDKGVVASNVVRLYFKPGAPMMPRSHSVKFSISGDNVPGATASVLKNGLALSLTALQKDLLSGSPNEIPLDVYHDIMLTKSSKTEQYMAMYLASRSPSVVTPGKSSANLTMTVRAN